MRAAYPDMPELSLNSSVNGVTRLAQEQRDFVWIRVWLNLETVIQGPLVPVRHASYVESIDNGGLAQGIAQALFEEIVYNESGQLITGSLMDYAVPVAEYLPSFETDRTETRTPVNELGAKGIGELATIGSAPAVVNAVMDALSPLGIRHLDMPLRPERIWQAIQAART